MPHREVRIANRQAEVRNAVALVEQFAADNCVPRAIVHDISVALDEALSNIIAYGYQAEAQGEITVRPTCTGDEMRIEIEDGGRAFNPLQAPPPDLAADLAERQVGGLGIHFIRSLMDAVAYDRHDGRNRLKMVKRIAGGAAHPDDGPDTHRRRDGVAIVEPHGRIDTASARTFADQIGALIRAGSRSLLVDLRDIIYVSSAGFRALLVARKLMDDTDGKIVLCGISPELRRLFEIGHFTDLFVICATRDEGLARAAGRTAA
jgi:serine/threonine-protein kinase RsbW/sigma-B regulation protein RsbU (phosphoserine phosphatase)